MLEEDGSFFAKTTSNLGEKHKSRPQYCTSKHCKPITCQIRASPLYLIPAMLLKSCSLWSRYPDDAYQLVQKGRLDGWYPDADLYENLIAWMCTQDDLVDEAEQIVRQELQVMTQRCKQRGRAVDLI